MAISFHKLQYRISPEGHPQKPILIKENPSFFIKSDRFDKYVPPIFSSQPTSADITPIDQSRVIMISAPGATGKTALAEELSRNLNLPIFDLGRHDPVGRFSFVGMLYKVLMPHELGGFISGLSEGSHTVVIDALDEGYFKSGQSSFESFLGDLADIAVESRGVPFVICGRTSILEYAALLFEEKGVPVSMLRIEPFTKDNAYRFVDNAIKKQHINKLSQPYRAARNYIIESLECCFSSEAQIDKLSGQRFIGYAPVLLSIACMLDDNLNYYTLKQDLEKDAKKNLDLLLSIIRMVMNRERVDKVIVGLDDMLASRPNDFCSIVRNEAFSEKEQCVRLLAKMMKRDIKFSFTEDTDFNNNYEERIKEWVSLHPFLDANGNAANIVFESYIVATLLNCPEYSDMVFDYLAGKADYNSYLLFDIYDKLRHSDIIPSQLIGYLMSSFQATDRTDNKGVLEIDAISDKQEGNYTRCYVSFHRLEDGGQEKSTTFQTDFEAGSSLCLGRYISNVIIDAPISISFEAPSIEFTSPVDIHASMINISSRDITFNASCQDSVIVLEAKSLVAKTSSGLIQSVFSNGKPEVKIITDSSMFFPLVAYKELPSSDLSNNPRLCDRYQKLRRIILHFRTHNKGRYAKVKSKIDNRIAAKPSGKLVLGALIAEGIITTDNTMYYLDQDLLSQKLGINFNSIRSSVITDRVKDFLNGLGV